MNEEKSDQEQGPASPSLRIDTAPTTDPTVAENESTMEAQSQPDQRSEPAVENESIDAEFMDAESVAAESVATESVVAESVADTVTDSVAVTMNLDATQKSPESTQTEEQMEVDAPQPADGSSTPEDILLPSGLADKLAEVTSTDMEPTGVDESSPDNASEVAGKEASNTAPLTTENLLSVLEDLPEKESSDTAENAESAPESEPQTAAAQSQAKTADATSESQSQSTPAQSQSTTSAEKPSEEVTVESEAAAPSTQTQAEAPQSVCQPVPTSDSQPESSDKAASELPPPKSSRKYVYKLRSKSGKVLQYTSSVPITLKKPLITLVKMDEGEDEEDEGAKSAVPRKVTRMEAEEVDSDNSTKENNVKANDASTPGTGPRIARKRGRPPLSQKTPVITLDDHHTPDAASNSKDTFKSAAAGSSTSTAAAYGMQTRKRQLKFLPDGRVVAPAGKKYKSAAAVAAATSSAKVAREENPSSDSDVLTDSDSGSQSDRKTKKPPQPVIPATKKIVPPERKVGAEKKPGIKKVFDYESLFRERSGMPLTTPSGGKTPNIIKKVVETPKSATVKPFNAGRSLTPSSSKSTLTLSSSLATPTSVNKNQVDPAQLLSSLIGVTILAHQLNVVKFKPKVIQDRKTVSAQKNVTFVDDSSKSSNKKSSSIASQKETLSQPILPSQRSTPFRSTPRTQLQRILPKPLPSDRTSTPIRKVLELPKAAAAPLLASPRVTPVATPIAASRLGVLQSKLGTALTSPVSPAFSGPSHRVGPAGDAPRFESFTDTKVVRTKEGPRKSQSQRSGDALAAGSKDKEEVQTVYELAQSLFEQIPSWNLHIMPDSNSFCIAQVSRGRMGIPILKKSIELNADFAAKVYVHQLHCKKYDGIYDTQSKILSLIREIDALAA